MNVVIIVRLGFILYILLKRYFFFQFTYSKTHTKKVFKNVRDDWKNKYFIGRLRIM